MSEGSVLGYLVGTRMSGQAENLATEALAYVLRSSAAVAAAFESYVRQAAPIPTGLYVETQASAVDAAIPDLVGLDATGATPFIGEAKFWAGLTANQPLTYLDRLPEGAPGVLLFIAPSIRLEVLWTELLHRLHQAGVQAAGDEGPPEFRRVDVGGGHVLALTSWRSVLAALSETAAAVGDRAALSDLNQLSGLCDRMDTEAFLPLAAEDLSGPAAVRLRQYLDVVSRSGDALVSRGIAMTKDASGGSLSLSAGWGWWGRYLSLAGTTTLLRISSHNWGLERATPVWLQVGYKNAPTLSQALEALSPLRSERSRVCVHANQADVAIDLPTGVELPDVVESVVAQVTAVRDCLATLQSG